MGGSEQAWPGVLGGKALDPPLPALPPRTPSRMPRAHGSLLAKGPGPGAVGTRGVSLERRGEGL